VTQLSCCHPHLYTSGDLRGRILLVLLHLSDLAAASLRCPTPRLHNDKYIVTGA